MPPELLEDELLCRDDTADQSSTSPDANVTGQSAADAATRGAECRDAQLADTTAAAAVIPMSQPAPTAATTPTTAPTTAQAGPAPTSTSTSPLPETTSTRTGGLAQMGQKTAASGAGDTLQSQWAMPATDAATQKGNAGDTATAATQKGATDAAGETGQKAIDAETQKGLDAVERAEQKGLGAEPEAQKGAGPEGVQSEAAQKGTDATQKGAEGAQKGAEGAQKGTEGAQKGQKGSEGEAPAGGRSVEPGGADAGAGGMCVAPPAMTSFDSLVLDDVMVSGQTNPFDTTVPATQATAGAVQQTGTKEAPGWGAKTMSALSQAVLGPISSDWRAGKVKQWNSIWGKDSIYGTGWIANVQKTIATTRMVVDSIGSIAGTVGLWSSLLSLVGLIPGLQPIGAFLATVGEVCTIIGIAASAINIALSALNMVITTLRMLYEKMAGVDSGAQYGAIFLDDVLNIGMSVVSIGLASAGGSVRAGMQGARTASAGGKSAVGAFFRGGASQIQKTTARNIARTGLPGMKSVANRVSAEGADAAGHALSSPRDLWRLMYNDQANRWAKTAIDRGLDTAKGATGTVAGTRPADMTDEMLAAWRAEQAALRQSLRSAAYKGTNPKTVGGSGYQVTVYDDFVNQQTGQNLNQGRQAITDAVPAAQPWSQWNNARTGVSLHSGTTGATGSAIVGGLNPGAAGHDVAANAWSRWIRAGIKTQPSIGSSALKGSGQQPQSEHYAPQQEVHKKSTGTAPNVAEGETAVAAGALQGQGQPVPYEREMSKRFGVDFSGAKAYTGAHAQGAAESIGAEAFTVGTRMGFSTASPSRATVAHELTHVLQATQGLRKRSNAGGRDAIEAEAEAAERSANRPAPVAPSRLPGVLAGAGSSQGADVAASVSARAQTAGQTVGQAIVAPQNFQGMEGTLPPDQGPLAHEYYAQLQSEREELLKMKEGLSVRRTEAKTAMQESQQATELGGKWQQFGSGVQQDAGMMRQKYGERRTALQNDGPKVADGMTKSDEIRGKADGVKSKAENTQGKGNVQQARYPENPTTWQRIKRFFLQGIVGRFNRAMERGKQILMNIVTKAVMSALNIDGFKQKLVATDQESQKGQQNLQQAEGKAQQGEVQAQKMQQSGADIQNQGSQKLSESQALDSELTAKEAEVGTRLAEIDAREAELKGKQGQYSAQFGPVVNATNAEIAQVNAGVGLEGHSTATVDADVQAILESAAEIQAASAAAQAEVDSAARLLGGAARADADDAAPGAGAGGRLTGTVDGIINAHRAGEAQRMNRVTEATSQAQGLAGQLATPANTTRLGELHRVLASEAGGIESAKRDTLAAMHQEFSSLYESLVSVSMSGGMEAAAP